VFNIKEILHGTRITSAFCINMFTMSCISFNISVETHVSFDNWYNNISDIRKPRQTCCACVWKSRDGILYSHV